MFLSLYISWKLVSCVEFLFNLYPENDKRLKELENKVEELDIKINPPKTEESLSPEVQEEVDKIRALGKTK